MADRKKKEKKEKIDIDWLTQLIKKEGIGSLYWVDTHVFMVSAREFLAFAKEDIRDKSTRGRINALCNAKRAIENRIDTLIHNYALHHYAKKGRWAFPDKIEKLSEIGIKIPNVLQNMITSKRNLLEHEYMVPKDQREVEDIIDIAELFLTASESHMRMGGGALRMINTPNGARDKFDDRNARSFVVFFHQKENSIAVYKDDWTEEIRISDTREKDMIRLVKAIMESHPTMESGSVEDEWEKSKYQELAEKMISKHRKK